MILTDPERVPDTFTDSGFDSGLMAGREVCLYARAHKRNGGITRERQPLQACPCYLILIFCITNCNYEF